MKIVLAITLLVAVAAISVEGQECDGSDFTLDPGNYSVSIIQTKYGYSLPTFPMEVSILSDKGNHLHVVVYDTIKVCLSVSGRPNCDDDFFILPYYIAQTFPERNVGKVYYTLTADVNSLSKLDRFLCPGFSPRQAVVITYYCVGDAPGVRELNMQVVILRAEDMKGANKTIILVIINTLWIEDMAVISSIGRNPKYYYIYMQRQHTTFAFDITDITGWTPPQNVPVLPDTCPIDNVVKCKILRNGYVTTFDGETKKMPNEKLLLAEWNPGVDECKFKLVAQFSENITQWMKIGVGPHKNGGKFFRYVDFNRPTGKIFVHGWKCKKGCAGPITTPEYDIANSDGTVYATVREVDEGVTYVVDTDLCSDATAPDYKLTFNFHTIGEGVMGIFELNGDFYDDKKEQLRGVCI